jgi:type I restriction enzyme S subunit
MNLDMEHPINQLVFEKSFFESKGFDASQIIYASYLIRVRLNSQLMSPSFLQYFLRTSHGRKALLDNSKTSAGQYNINTHGLSSINIPLPKIQVQQRIIEELNNKFSAVNTIEKLANVEQESIKSISSSLLRQAFSGII